MTLEMPLPQPNSSGMFELTKQQEAALSTPALATPALPAAPEHVVLDLSPEALSRCLQTIPTDSVRFVAVRLWTIGTGVCAICETPIDTRLRHPHLASAQVDHFVPQSRGGGDHWGNLRATHRQCNMERNDAITRELTPTRAQELLTAAVYRREHPSEFLPTEIESERRILSVLEGFVAETRAALRHSTSPAAPTNTPSTFCNANWRTARATTPPRSVRSTASPPNSTPSQR